MERATRISLLLVLTAFAGPAAMAEDRLDAAAINALIKGKTVVTHHQVKNRDVTTYYAADGTASGTRGSKRFIGTWHVSDSGELCVHDGKKKRCRFIVNENGSYRTYGTGTFDLHGTSQMKPIATVTSITDGNINN